MAHQQLGMTPLRQLLYLASQGKTRRQMVEQAHISRRTVDGYMALFRKTILSFSVLLDLSDIELKAALRPPPSEGTLQSGDPRHDYIQQNLPRFHAALSHKHVTRVLLWEEYRCDVPDGYSYGQFCQHLHDFSQVKQASMIHRHQPAQEMQIDFAGDKLSWVDTATGEIYSCPVLICTLPFSGLLFCTPLPNAKLESLIDGLNDALGYYGGVSKSVKSDNMAQIVTKASRYEPAFTEIAQQWANHNRTTLMATRVGRPKDKPHVEGNVRNSYYRIYAPLRYQTFYSLRSLKAAVLELVNKFNDKLFQGKRFSRISLYDQDERHLMGTLPAGPFVMFWSTKAKVQKDYHVTLGEDMHYYSVPFRLIGKEVTIVYTQTTVEIYRDQERVCFHAREFSRHRHSTLAEHMPERHQHYRQQQEWDVDYFMRAAEKIGPMTYLFIERLFASRVFAPQAFKHCQGVFRLEKKYGAARLEAACYRASAIVSAGPGILANILCRGMDAAPADPSPEYILPNDNLRGNQEYQ